MTLAYRPIYRKLLKRTMGILYPQTLAEYTPMSARRASSAFSLDYVCEGDLV